MVFYPRFAYAIIALWLITDASASPLPGELESRRVLSGSYTTIPGHDCFRNIDGMTDAMFDLEDQYPDLVSIESIGKSYLGVDIYALKLTAKDSQASSKGVVLLTSGIHAREYAPPELLMRFAENIVANYNVSSDNMWILEHTEIHIVLYVNPDGRRKAEEQPGTLWRKNVNPRTSNCSTNKVGVDINRNFAFLWGNTNGASANPCAGDYMGPFEQSEPETVALTEYAKSIFPEDQRKNDPEGQMAEPFGEDIMGLYMDIHSYGGYVYYPWGHKDAKSPDNSSLEAVGRKLSSFNGYDLWAGGQPDFLYAVSGDSSDYMYAVLGLASFGLEVGRKFYESCDTFENEIIPDNLPALLYAAKLSSKPNHLGKGPDILTLSADMNGDTLTVTASASDSQLVNVGGLPSFETGDQSVSSILISFDVHPDDAKSDEIVEMSSRENGFVGTLSLSGISSGKHILYAQAKDSDGYSGPVSSIFVTVSEVPSTTSPTLSPTSQWVDLVSEDFTSGFGIFVKTGTGVRRFSKAMKRQGVVRVKNGALQTSVIGSYSHISVTFSAMFPTMADEVCLEYKPVSEWKKVKCWTGSEFTTGMWHDDISEEMITNGITDLPIRWSCGGFRRRVFVDKVALVGKS